MVEYELPEACGGTFGGMFLTGFFKSFIHAAFNPCLVALTPPDFRSILLAYSLSQLEEVPQSPSSSGLGHHPFTVSTGVRIPLGTPALSNSLIVKLNQVNQ